MNPNAAKNALCTKPEITADDARKARGMFDNSAQPELLPMYPSGITVNPDQVLDAHLTVDRSLEDNQPTPRAHSITWHLVWAVDVQQRSATLLIDAATGQTVGLRTHHVTW